MKKIYLLAAAAALFAACSSEKDSLETQQQPAQLEEGAVGFDAYTQRATTRGGWTGSLTTDALKGLAKTGGFGVFGYYTDNNEYDQRSTPNFFYNQLVYWDGGSWSYEPVKYWPNEYGTNAISEDQDKVTYFAYAPWIEVIPTSGKLANTDNDAEEWGITGMTRNSNQGDPILKYIAQFNSNRSVDLCWGVADNNDGIWPITQTGTKQTIDNGMPWIDVERPANTNQRVKFTFKHALAQMRVNIDAFVDGTDKTNELSPKTRIWVREVTFKGFAMKGALNLHNEDKNDPKWLDYGGQNELVAEGVTIYDGRKDGKEGVNGAIATNEKVTGLNPILVQDGLYEKTDGENVYESSALNVYGVDANGVLQTGETNYNRAGVTNTTVDLFAQNLDNANNTSTGNSIFHVIPTDEDVEVEIVYDVETVSENLAQNLSDGATKGSSIENRITKHITFGTSTGTSESRLEAGHSYTLNLHLGMNSVKFDAAVTEWVDVQDVDIDLPLNVPAFPVGTSGTPATKDVAIPYTGNYTFALTGLEGGESVAYAVVGDPLSGWSGSANNANTSGVAIQTITTATNPTTTNRQHVATWIGNQSNKGVQITFTQQAHPLNLKISSLGGTTITLERDAEFAVAPGDNTGWYVNGTGRDKAIYVWRNGTKLTENTGSGTLAKNEFRFSDAGDADKLHNTIEIGEKLQTGDVIKVELTTGDAPIETVTGTVEGTFGYYPAALTIPYKSAAYTDILPSYAKGLVTYSKVDVAGVLDGDVATNGSFITAKPGSVTIKAKDNKGTPDDTSDDEEKSLSLEVVKQPGKITGFKASENIASPGDGSSGSTIVNLGNASYSGTIEANTGTVAYSIVSATISSGSTATDVKDKLRISHPQLKVKDTQTLEAGNYEVVIKATGTPTVNSDKFDTVEEEHTFTFTITAP